MTFGIKVKLRDGYTSIENVRSGQVVAEYPMSVTNATITNIPGYSKTSCFVIVETYDNLPAPYVDLADNGLIVSAYLGTLNSTNYTIFVVRTR